MLSISLKTLAGTFGMRFRLRRFFLGASSATTSGAAFDLLDFFDAFAEPFFQVFAAACSADLYDMPPALPFW